MKIAAAFAAALVVAIAVLVWSLAPGGAGAQSALDAPSNLTATPGAGAVHLSWTAPANAEYHFVAWLPVGAPAGDAQILPADTTGEATIPGLTPGQAYCFTVIASRWEWSPADFGPKWSEWSAFATATPLVSEPAAVGPKLRLNTGPTLLNESILLQGENLGRGPGVTIDPADITIDGVPLLVDEVSLNSDGKVAVSDSGDFWAIVHLWSAGSDSNPAFTPGTNVIRARSSQGFSGTAAIVIKEPTLIVTPARARPRDYIIITGANWPMDNQNSPALVGYVDVVVENR